MPEFIDRYGIAITYDHYPARGKPRASIQLLHGVGEHAGRYRELAEALAGAGYAVYADDHRGHGRTGVAQHSSNTDKLGRLGAGGLRGARDACWQFTRLIRDENPGLPLAILGHSWGSFLAQMLVNEHPDAYDAIILSGSALRWPGSLNSGDLNKPWAKPGAMGTEWLAADLSVGREFLADPLTTTTPLPKLFGPLDTLQLMGKPKKNLGKDIPTLLMVGEDDTVGGPRGVSRLAAAYRDRSGFTDVSVTVYPGARHEIFNDFCKGQAQADALDWLSARFGARD